MSPGTTDARRDATALDAPEPSSRTLTARQLRVLAEKAEGWRGKGPLVVIETTDGHEVITEEDLRKRRSPANIVARVVASEDVPERERPARIDFYATADSAVEPLVDGFDALFWSEAAVQKFLFPYYHSLRLLTPQAMEQLERSYRDKKSIAFAHKIDSRTLTMRTLPTDEKKAGLLPDDVYVFPSGAGKDVAVKQAWVSIREFLTSLERR
jgi:hypothetical protein